MKASIGRFTVDARAAALVRVIWALVALPRLLALPVVDLAFAWPMRLALGAVAYGLTIALGIGHRARGVGLLLVLTLGALGGRSSALLDGSERWLRATVLFLPFCELAAAWSREVLRGERPALRRVPLLPLVAVVAAGGLVSLHLLASRLPSAMPIAATLGMALALALPPRVLDRLRPLPASTVEGQPRTSTVIVALLGAQLALFAWGIAAAHGLVQIPRVFVDELGLLGIRP